MNREKYPLMNKRMAMNLLYSPRDGKAVPANVFDALIDDVNDFYFAMGEKFFDYPVLSSELAARYALQRYKHKTYCAECTAFRPCSGKVPLSSYIQSALDYIQKLNERKAKGEEVSDLEEPAVLDIHFSHYKAKIAEYLERHGINPKDNRSW